MEKTAPVSNNGRGVAALAAALLVFLIVMLAALINAPTAGGPRVMASPATYFAEVQKTAMPFVIIVGILALILAAIVYRVVYREWSNPVRRQNLVTGYAFILPYLLITSVFTIGVILFAFSISFTQYDIFTPPEFVGLDNYAKAFEGFVNPARRAFLQSLYNVLWYSIIVVPVQTALAIFLAVLLNAPIRMRNFFRTIFYAPSVTSSVVITLIFMWFYLKTGYLNFFFDQFLGIFGIEWKAIDWLGDPRGLIQLIVEPLTGIKIPSNQWYLRGPSIAWMAIMFQNIFTTAPTFMIMFLAALQDINPTLYEAAEIDGASGWQRFWKITLPLLRPIILFVVVMGTIGTLQIFDQVYLATKGGPLNTSLTPVYLTFTEALGRLGPIRMGYASALAFIVTVIIFTITFFQRRFLERGTELY